MADDMTINDNTRQVMRDIGKMTHNGVKNFLQTARTITKRNAPVRKRTSSGHLGGNHRDGVSEEMLGRRKGHLFSQSGYGAYLEFGTHKMEARPHFGPAIQLAIVRFKAGGEWNNL